MADEKELVRKRGSYKAQLTMFTSHVNSLGVSSLTQAEAAQLQLRIRKLELLYQQYDEVQLKLECMTDTLDTQIGERNEFESAYYAALSKAQGISDNFNKKREEFETCSHTSSTNNRRLVKLPTIQLPKFSGSYDRWLEFRDTFTSLIHSNGEIDSINKFHYLRASLEGTAAQVIISLEFSGKNYDVAWDLLCERFDNKRLLLHNHVSALFNVEPITKESSIQIKRVIDQVNKSLRSLECLGEPVEHWDTLLIYIISKKLDSKTFREWEEHKGNVHKNERITFEAFLTFMRNRADLIESLEMSFSSAAGQSNQPAKHPSKHRTMLAAHTGNKPKLNNTLSLPCPNCHSEHALVNCPSFLALSNAERYKQIQSYKICFNCFATDHYANRCRKPGCKTCKRKHHSLVHLTDQQIRTSDACASDQQFQVNNVNEPPPRPAAPSTAAPIAPVTLSARLVDPQHEQTVLLSTALVRVYDIHGCVHTARAILDSGSTSCIITQDMCTKLMLPTNSVEKSVAGINNSKTHVGKMCKVSMGSLDGTYSTSIHCFILPNITDHIPSQQINISNLAIPSNLRLADPYFHTPAAIDIIIGADLFWDLLGSQRIKLGNGMPVLCETMLGWLVSGPIHYNNTDKRQLSRTIHCNFASIVPNQSNDSLNDIIQAQLPHFWQLEELSCSNLATSSCYSPEEKLCEDHFIKNTIRLEDGRFCVRLPLKQSSTVLGDSESRAKRCFLSLERRIEQRPEFRDMYKDFMSEYLSLNHMSEYKPIMSHPNAYFIPHHGVVRESSSTTKLRVVFNASSPTSSGVSLNEIQMVGPTVQDDLLSILLRFRQHKYVIAADVEKMYRQIAVHPDDRHLQQIIWRNDPSDELKVFQLNTVTYGTSSAPFLATRCLKQIGLECEDEVLREVIVHDFYVDDLLTGGDDLNQVKAIQMEVAAALRSACMNLRKWKSNSPHLLTCSGSSSLDLNIGVAEPGKTLGLGWQPASDELHFPIGNLTLGRYTKREMLSVMSQVFDPLGLLAPCVILMKILMQKLWLQKLSWDEPLSPEVSKQWIDMIRGLSALNSTHVPRLVLCDSYQSVECHVFTDASERAYGACLYLRTINGKGEISVNLLLAKSRVAPLKPTTIPRLELCGALVGTRLYEKVIGSLRLRIDNTTFWTDSTIVLGWLKMVPSRLQPFVRNRAAEIVEKTGTCVWRHVPTDENPADHISRGVHAQSINSLDIWWSGPSFLKHDRASWPQSPSGSTSLPETRPEISLNVTVQNICENSTLIDFDRFSNLTRLKRCVAYALRFISSCKKQVSEKGYLTETELRNAMNLIIRISQEESFPDYNLLLAKKSLPSKSPLLKFNVFLDTNLILRVGGRLGNSEFSYEKKHPALIQSTHRFTLLLFQHEHKRLLHAAPQLLLATIRETYWPIGGTQLAKACFRKCVLCTRLRGKVLNPIMGNLPCSRLSPNFPFDSVGVDYAGPLQSVSRQGRGSRIIKVYAAIFICFTTKAIHLELVGDLTSNNYLAALRRFVSRRGKPSNIYSDNGTSFVGAYNELSKFLKSNCDKLAESAASEEINFHFIPAYSPHFGGLWEAGVKSTKFHLFRVLGYCNLTYEELNTVLVQIEAILNSRPLTPMSSSPEDLLPLTPGHFLIGRSLQSLPEQNHQNTPSCRLSRHQRIQQLRQHFWLRWSKEYISELQVRTKWREDRGSLKINSLVLLKDDHLPPLKWKLGRITALYPGSDGVARVADIKTSSGTARRSFSKICPLPEAS